MPHAVLECSANLIAPLKEKKLCSKVHAAMDASGLFKPDEIKIRLHGAEAIHIGLNGEDGLFLHAFIYLLEGRTTEKKQMLSRTVLETLRELTPAGTYLSVDVRELVRDTYSKN